MQRLSLKERSPFLKTIDIWEERKLLSSTFLAKLRTVWQKTSTPQSKDLRITSEDLSIAHRPKLIHADPKLCDLREISTRLSTQMTITSSLAKDLISSCPQSPDSLYPCESIASPIHDPCVPNRILVSLCAELNVCDPLAHETIFNRT